VALPRPSFSHARLQLALGAVFIAALLCFPAGAAAQQAVGAQLHPLWSNTSQADFDRELDMLKQAGANTARIDLSWASLETEGRGQRSQWFVDKTDTFLDHAQARGIKVIATLWATPCWASSAPADLRQGCAGAWWDRRVDRYAPTAPSDYADAAQWVARRWGGRLHALEIWNEPNEADHSFLRSPDPAASYAAIVKSAYPAVKAVAPGLPVLAGATSFNDRAFIARLYELGLRGNHDGISIHPYSENRDPDLTRGPGMEKWTFRQGVAWIRELMVANGDGAKGLWLTELGWSTCTANNGWCVPEAKQAEYVADSVRIAREWSYVKAMVVYNLRDKSSNPGSREGQFGLVRRDFTPKPAYAALAGALGAGGGPSRPSGSLKRRPALQLVRLGRAVKHNRRVRLRLRCVAGAGRSCRGMVRMAARTRASSTRLRRTHSKASGPRRFGLRPGRSAWVSVRLSRRARIVLRRGRRLPVRVMARLRSHSPGNVARSFVLKPSRR